MDNDVKAFVQKSIKSENLTNSRKLSNDKSSSTNIVPNNKSTMDAGLHTPTLGGNHALMLVAEGNKILNIQENFVHNDKSDT